MKTISDYTYYCTKEQTKKALELGAPIRINKNGIFDNPITIIGYSYLEKIDNHENEFTIPTVEEMVGWLRDVHNIRIELYSVAGILTYDIKYPDGTNEQDSLFTHDITYSKLYALNIHAAIDAALEYLSNNNK